MEQPFCGMHLTEIRAMMGPPKQPHTVPSVDAPTGDLDPLFPGEMLNEQEVAHPPPRIYPIPYAGQEYPGCWDAEDDDPSNNKRG